MVEKKPGGTISVVKGEIVFSGSKCRKCGMEMEERRAEIIPGEINVVIVNPLDGRNS